MNLQNRNRLTDIENKLVVAKGWGRAGMDGEIGIDMYTLICIKQITNENPLYSTGNSTSLYSRN